MLEKYFPDWTERMNYQNQQFEFLQSGIKKIREANKLRMNESQKLKLLTSQEKEMLVFQHLLMFLQWFIIQKLI